MNDEVREFLQRNRATAELSKHKMCVRRVPSWSLKNDALLPFEAELEREPMVEIYMPQDNFRDLVEKDRWAGKLSQEVHYYKQRYLEEIEDDKIRHRNPAVRKAWEQYRMLLELAR